MIIYKNKLGFTDYMTFQVYFNMEKLIDATLYREWNLISVNIIIHVID